MTGASHQQLVGFIWGVADLLRADYKRSANEGRFTHLEPALRRAAEQPCFDDSPLDFRGLVADPANVAANLRTYVDSLWAGAADVLEKYGFEAQISRLADAGLLSGAPPLRRPTAASRRLAQGRQALDARGTLDILHRGVKDHGVLLRLAYFARHTPSRPNCTSCTRTTGSPSPASSATPQQTSDQLDLALFVNGIRSLSRSSRTSSPARASAIPH